MYKHDTYLMFLINSNAECYEVLLFYFFSAIIKYIASCMSCILPLSHIPNHIKIFSM